MIIVHTERLRMSNATLQTTKVQIASLPIFVTSLTVLTEKIKAKFRHHKASSVRGPLWDIHNGCLRNRYTDWGLDQEEWVVWFQEDSFILHLNRDRDLNSDREELVMYPFFRS